MIADIDPQWAVIIAAVFSGLAAALGAINGYRVRNTAKEIGVTNGQGNLADMVARIDRRVGTMDERHILIEQKVDDLVSRVDHIEHRLGRPGTARPGL